jgi:hypothetical protein
VTNSKQENRREGDWRLAFADDGSGDWREKWFLDGDTAFVENTPQGMILRAGRTSRTTATAWCSGPATALLAM